MSDDKAPKNARKWGDYEDGLLKEWNECKEKISFFLDDNPNMKRSKQMAKAAFLHMNWIADMFYEYPQYRKIYNWLCEMYNFPQCCEED